MILSEIKAITYAESRVEYKEYALLINDILKYVVFQSLFYDLREIILFYNSYCASRRYGSYSKLSVLYVWEMEHLKKCSILFFIPGISFPS